MNVNILTEEQQKCECPYCEPRPDDEEHLTFSIPMYILIVKNVKRFLDFKEVWEEVGYV